jgi:hypothetical protein
MQQWELKNDMLQEGEKYHFQRGGNKYRCSDQNIDHTDTYILGTAKCFFVKVNSVQKVQNL